MQGPIKNHKIREFRIVLPMSVEEYHVGQLWSVAQASKSETGGGDGVEVIINEPFTESEHPPQTPLFANGQTFTKGQYTHKVYHLTNKVPGFVKVFAPKGSLQVHEKAWNAYPYCRTVITNDYMKEHMYIIIETFHYADAGVTENIHGLTGTDLKNRDVVQIDVADKSKVKKSDYKPEWDPCLVEAPKSGRDPLPAGDGGAWRFTAAPVMCCYKLVKVWFKWFGVQGTMESFILKQENRLFTNFHRQVVCWQDEYHGMTMEDIRRLEEETKAELERQRQEEGLKGMVADDSDK